DHCFLKFFFVEVLQTAAELKRQYFLDVALVALLQRFADANAWAERSLMRRAHFAIYNFVGLAKQRSPFAVTEDYVAHEQVAQERGADLAGEGAVWFPMHVLGADFDALRRAERFHHFRDGGEWRNNDNFDIGAVADLQQERLHETRRFGLRHVHLPIRCDDFLAHKI